MNPGFISGNIGDAVITVRLSGGFYYIGDTIAFEDIFYEITGVNDDGSYELTKRTIG